MSDNELPDDVNALITREYQKMFDEFVYARNLDIDDAYWSPGDKVDWRKLFTDFKKRWSWAKTWL